MWKKTILFFLFFQLVLAQQEKISAIQLSTLKSNFDKFEGYDGEGNLYFVKNNILHKKTEAQMWQYKNVALGKITKVDFQNQLKIMLFYENFNSVILLDNQLSEAQKINFSEIEVPLFVSATGIASQNRLWIYNSLTQQIGLFDYLKNTFQSLTPAIVGSIKYYETDFNTFQWIDNQWHWYSCDIFGKIRLLGKLVDFDQIQIVSNQKVIYSKDANIVLYDLQHNRDFRIENVDKSFKKMQYKDQILTIFTGQEIVKYKINLP